MKTLNIQQFNVEELTKKEMIDVTGGCYKATTSGGLKLPAEMGMYAGMSHGGGVDSSYHSSYGTNHSLIYQSDSYQNKTPAQIQNDLCNGVWSGDISCKDYKPVKDTTPLHNTSGGGFSGDSNGVRYKIGDSVYQNGIFIGTQKKPRPLE